MHDVQLYNRMKNAKGTISRKEAYSFRSIIHYSLFIESNSPGCTVFEPIMLRPRCL